MFVTTAALRNLIARWGQIPFVEYIYSVSLHQSFAHIAACIYFKFSLSIIDPKTEEPQPVRSFVELSVGLRGGHHSTYHLLDHPHHRSKPAWPGLLPMADHGDETTKTQAHHQHQQHLNIKPWYHHLTLDLLTHVLSRSVFHPAIVLIFWLCLCGMHKHRSPTAFYTLYYAAFLATVDCLMWVNHRIAYGKPRKVEWEKEVVIVTGGGRGLGRVIVESLVRRGVKVGVLDVKERDEGVEELVEGFDLVWERCDVGDGEEVGKAMGRIAEEVSLNALLCTVSRLHV